MSQQPTKTVQHAKYTLPAEDRNIIPAELLKHSEQLMKLIWNAEYISTTHEYSEQINMFKHTHCPT